MLWFTEYYTGESMDLKSTGLTVKVKSAVTTKTSFQEVMLLNTEDFGKVLVLDGAIQTTEKDEFIYHEMIVHPALFTIGKKPERVLIIGGGDGGTAREVLKHEPENVELVEIDREVVEVSKQELPTISSSLDDEKVTIIFDDGREYIKGKEKIYDVVIVDCSDPIGPSKSLYKEEFYRDVFNALKDDGILVTQSESPFAQNRVHRMVVKELQKVFPIVRPYLAFIPTYPSGMWSFTIASRTHDPLSLKPEELVNKVSSFEKKSGRLRYYNSQIHYGAFAVPNFVYEEK